jgi:membrane protein YqaA with SNARE-associated domain
MIFHMRLRRNKGENPFHVVLQPSHALMHKWASLHGGNLRHRLSTGNGHHHMTTILTYASLFAVAFLAATLLPVQSEAILAGLLALGQENWLGLLAVATAGNTMGAMVNWALGRGLEHYQHRRWFPVGPNQLAKARAHYQTWGRWCLFFSWLPVVGDAFTVLAGVLGEKLWLFTLIVGAGKLARYLVVAAAVAGFWA